MKPSFKDLVHFNMHAETYGRVYRIKRAYLLCAFAVLCIVTPCTNWLIPFSHKIIKHDVVVRTS